MTLREMSSEYRASAALLVAPHSRINASASLASKMLKRAPSPNACPSARSKRTPSA